MIGFYVEWMPVYVLGFIGVTRRLNMLEDRALQPYFVIAFLGVLMIASGIGAMLMQLFASLMRRKQLKDVTGDPPDGYPLEW